MPFLKEVGFVKSGKTRGKRDFEESQKEIRKNHTKPGNVFLGLKEFLISM